MQAIRRGPTPALLRRLYAGMFKGFNLHHMIPRSRKGNSFEFNMFPFLIEAHNAWHVLFLNLTIVEIWSNLESIYKSIFDTNKETVKMKWLLDCKLEADDYIWDIRSIESFERNVKRLAKNGMSAERLRQKWIVCFGGEDLHLAESVMKMMMLVMVFGHKIVEPEHLFDNGKITEIVDLLPSGGPRDWAFRNCFNTTTVRARGVKAMTRKILESYPHY